MKTSNKLIIVVITIILFALVAYDFALKKEYVSGDYKIPFRSFDTLNFKDFDVVDLSSSTASNAKIIQGPFKVLVAPNAVYTRVRQQGNRLEIDAAFPGSYRNNSNDYMLLISCPYLKEVNANATYLANDKKVTDSVVRDEWFMRQVLIDGFNQDSLHIKQDYGSTIVLANNTIRSVSAAIGISPYSGSKLVVKNNNHFENAVIDVRYVSQLLMENAAIGNFSYNMSDSAKLVINGDAQHLLNHPK